MKEFIRLFVRPWHNLFHLPAFIVLSGLLITCKEKSPKPLALKASFKLENNNCTAPCDPGVTDLSQNALAYRWDFGDGTASTEENPEHTYAKGGSYPLKLTVTGEQNQTADTTLTVTIKDTPLPVAAFAVQNDNCTAACEVTFANQSQNALSYQWDFGDGATSTQAAPKRRYTKAGSFAVKLTVTGQQGRTATATKTVTIKAQPVPVADFVIQNDNCVAPCTVILQNKSQNGTSYSWEITTSYTPSDTYISGFAPRSRNSIETNPSQAYRSAAPRSVLKLGIVGVSEPLYGPRLPYTVKLTATGPGGTHAVAKSVTIRPQKPTADFTFTSDSRNREVRFVSKATDAVSYKWDFGTGGLTSTAQNPKISVGVGKYTATLKVTNETGTAEVKKTYSMAQHVN